MVAAFHGRRIQCDFDRGGTGNFWGGGVDGFARVKGGGFDAGGFQCAGIGVVLNDCAIGVSDVLGVGDEEGERELEGDTEGVDETEGHLVTVLLAVVEPLALRETAPVADTDGDDDVVKKPLLVGEVVDV